MTNLSKYLKGAALGMALLVAGEAVAASSTLGDYFEAASGLIPNKISLSCFEEVNYNDNIHDAIKGQERDSMIFKTGVTVDLYRVKGGINYGLIGDFSYDYYTKDSGDFNQFEWNISPHILGSFELLGLDKLMLSFETRSKIETVSTADTRYARHHTNGIHAVYDYGGPRRLGFMLTGDYVYEYYPQDDFKSYSNQEYGFSFVPYYKVTEKIRTGIRLGYSETVYDYDYTNDDSDTITLNAFVDYRMTSFFSVYVEAGCEKQSYDGASKDSNNDRDYVPDYAITLRYLPISNLAIDIKSSVSPDDSLAGKGNGQSIDFDNSLTVRWFATSKISLQQTVGLDVQDEKNNNNDTHEFYYDARADYKCTEKLSFYAGYRYNNVQFDYEDDSDYYVNECYLGVRWSF